MSPSTTTPTFPDRPAVTVSSGHGNAQEWVALYVATNSDSSYSFEGNWKYLNGLQSAPATPAPYPVNFTFVAPTAVGAYNIRYFKHNGYDEGKGSGEYLCNRSESAASDCKNILLTPFTLPEEAGE